MIVAMARELGAGGRDVGERTAAQLNAELLDKQIVDLVAARIGAPASYVAQRDENVEGFVERLFRAITAADPEAYSAARTPDWSEERLVRLTADIISERAAERSVVVIGRGAPSLLKDRAGILRVFVSAPCDVRCLRVMQRAGCSAEEAARKIKDSDRHRAAYVQQYYGIVWQDHHNYDLVVNTGRLTPEAAGRLIADAARELEAKRNRPRPM
ncbi:MAG: cytidylate kinase-like family protein [Candidatus Eremiobacteraeota bacterium]|nr:cytidylate kinase-like family protein [Candidatus Eremiobacteraeota bacterium]MBC5827378.1 cytidylate kinase-like family protein [Candidatus Eremiobacteraeota bacterium]